MKDRKRIFNGVIAIFLLCVATSCSYVRYFVSPGGDGSGQFSSAKENREEDRRLEWYYYFPNYIIPRMCAYYQLHPERFKPTGIGEEIEIEGFFEFVKNDGYFKSVSRASIRKGKIRDPWGDPVHFVQDLNMDGYIEADGERCMIVDPTGRRREVFANQLNLGIFKQRPYQTSDGNQGKRIFARPCQ